MDEVMKIKANVSLDDVVIKTRITDTSKGGTDNYNDLYNLPTLNGVVIKGHGNSDAYQIKNALKVAVKVAESNIVNKIQEALNHE